MNEYNVIQYVIPKETEMIFSILSHERRVSIRLLSGSALLCYNKVQKNIPLDEYELPLWESLFPRVKSIADSDFIVRGNHYVFQAFQKMPGIYRDFFRVSQSDDTYSFNMEENTQLQIFVVEDDKSDVTIKCSEGSCQIFGQHVPEEYSLILIPCTTFVVNSRDDTKFSVCISGLKRRVKVSLMDETHLTCMRIEQDRVHMECLLAKRFTYTGPTVLVVGPTNMGKTSFCHTLLSRAIYEGRSPIYVNLDVRRDTPGAISLCKISDHMDIKVGFAHFYKILLHFGSVLLNSNTIKLYHRLVRKMGELAIRHQSSNQVNYSATVIDMCGMLGQDKRTIECVVQAFSVKMLIYVGNDNDDYENIKQILPRLVETHFLPAPENIEPQSGRWEANYLDFKIREYFYGDIKRPDNRKLSVVKIENIRICRVVTANPGRVLINGIIEDLKIECVTCDPSLENCLLAFVSDNLNERNPALALAEVRYYVCFEKVDLKTNTVTVLSPENESFTGGVLLTGSLKLSKDAARVGQ